MKDFKYHTPTEVIFGVRSEDNIAELVKKYGGNRVLLHYGGNSAERSGLLGDIRKILTDAGIKYVELGGVIPNPVLSKVYEGIELGRREGIDFILAVGGGSVIDSAKAIAYGIPYNDDVWDFFSGKDKASAIIPLGTVLTIPAAGSEMSNGCVITNEDGNLKRAYDDDLSRPRFAVMNPVRTFTLPSYQTACGIVDIMMHTMERYFTHDTDMNVTDNLAESLLRSVMESAPIVLAHPDNYRHRAQIMWAGSLAHNGLTECGLTSDWSTHLLEHEVSAMFNVAHGAGLAALWGSWARYVYKEDISRFVRFAVNVMNIANDFTDPAGTALRGIEAMEGFYKSIGMPVSLSQLLGRDVTDDEIEEMSRKCSSEKSSTIGQFRRLGYDDMVEIYRMAR